MNLQEINSNLQNSSAALLRTTDANFMEEQLAKVTVSETKSGVNMQIQRKVDSATADLVKDSSSTNMFLPLYTSSHGIFNSHIISWIIHVALKERRKNSDNLCWCLINSHFCSLCKTFGFRVNMQRRRRSMENGSRMFGFA